MIQLKGGVWMEKRQLPENEIKDKIKEIYRLKYEDFSKTGRPRRILFRQIADTLNSEGILAHHDKEWTWQNIHSFVGRHPSIKGIV